MPMTPDDHVALKSIIDAFPQHLRRAYDRIITMMLDDAKEGRCTLPDLDNDNEATQTATLDLPGNRGTAWMEILTSLTLSSDTQDVFDDQRLVGFISALCYCVRDGTNPFEGNAPDIEIEIEDDEDEDEEDTSTDDIALSPVIERLLKQSFAGRSLREDSIYVLAPANHSTYVAHLGMDEDAFLMVSNVLTLFNNSLTLERRYERTIQKPKKLKELKEDLNRSFIDQLGVLSNTLYRLCTLPAVTAINTATTLMGCVEAQGLETVLRDLCKRVQSPV